MVDFYQIDQVLQSSGQNIKDHIIAATMFYVPTTEP